MTSVRVAIATTEGPAEVQALAPEDAPDVMSVICVDGGSEALPVSRAYDGFVRRPTGVIEARFGQRVWRMDVSAPIGDGESWQLGTYAAHLLYHGGTLAGDQTSTRSGVYLLATGQVDTRLNVRPVTHVEAKIRAAAPALRQATAAGKQVILALPADNQTESLTPLLDELNLGRVRILACRHVGDLESALDTGSAAPGDSRRRAGDAATAGQADISGPSPAETHGACDAEGETTARPAATEKAAGIPHTRRGGLKRAIAVSLAVVLLLGLAGAWLLRDLPALANAASKGDYGRLAEILEQRNGDLCLGCTVIAQWAASKRPAPTLLATDAAELAASGIRTCKSATLGGGRYTARPLGSGPTFPESEPGKLCALQYRVRNTGGEPIPLLLAVNGRDGLLARNSARSLPPSNSLTVRVDRRQLQRTDDTLRVVVLAGGLGPGDIAAATNIRPGLLSPDAGDPDSLGIRRRTLQHPLSAGATTPRFQ